MAKRVSCSIASLFMLSLSLALGQQPADTILFNARVLTVDANFSIAEAVAVREGKIVAVGKNEDVLKLAGPNTVKLDLKGRTVTPGIINTHQHVNQGAEGGYGGELGPEKLLQYPINWRIVKTKDDVLKQMKDIMDAFKFKPGEWVYFSNSRMSLEQYKLLWEDMDRWDFDKVTPNNPVMLSLGVPANSGYITNSKGIEILWAKYGDFIEKYGRYWVDDQGRPDGHLEPPAGRLAYAMLPTPKPEDVATIYGHPLEDLAFQGVTTTSTRLIDYSIEAYKILDQKGEMPIRLAYGFQSAFDTPDPSLWKDKKLKTGSDFFWLISVTSGAVDGAGFSYCTDLKRNNDAVPDEEGSGILGRGILSLTANNPKGEWFPRGWCHADIEYKGGLAGKAAPIKGNYFGDWYQEVAQHGLRVANNHVGGDGSHRMIISMYERIDAAKPGAVKGWGLDHCSLINPKDIPRAARLGLMFSCNPGFVRDGPNKAKVFGEEVAHNFISPVGSLTKAGINVSLEGEGGRLWHNIALLVNRKDDFGKVWGAHERVDRPTALRIATINGARYVMKEDQIGSLEVGKLADLIVIDKDYLTVPDDEITNIRTLVTMVNGKFVFIHPEFAGEYNFRPAGAHILTEEQIRARRKPFQSSRS
ncbi:MAG: amidohydrolase family protein [Acidobacteria bacterium]|nr:amidohydrolase family protein [Acidobacteriota bacterium]